MNKRAIYFALAYSIFVIIFKLIIIFGGFGLTNFGFKYSHIISVFLIIPFIAAAIFMEREKTMGGFIRGREGLKIGVTVVMISSIILALYGYFEFEYYLRDLSKEYYSSPEFYQKYLDFYKANPKAKQETFEKVVELNVSGLDTFRFITVRLISFVLIGFACAFLCAVFLKKTVKA